MAALYRNATNYTVPSAASQVQLINHSFKKHSVKLQIKSQITLQVLQSCSQAVSSALRLPSESFSFSDFFKGPLLSGGQLFSGIPLLSGFKVTSLSGTRYFRVGRYFRNSTIVYYASKPIERVVYCFYEITMENPCQREENLLYFRDQVAYSHQNHEMTRQTNHSD